MCSLLGKESLPAERSMQQNRNMELLGEHRNLGMRAHMRTRFHREGTMVNTPISISEEGEARHKNRKVCPDAYLSATEHSEARNVIMSLLCPS